MKKFKKVSFAFYVNELFRLKVEEQFSIEIINFIFYSSN